MKHNYLFMLALLCAFIFAIAPVNQANAAFYDEHTGDSWEDAYIIDSVEDLKDWHERYNVSTNGKYFKLANNISITFNTYDSRYSNGYINYFNGYFDGQNNTITVNINTENFASFNDAALFGIVSNPNSNSEASIKNLNVRGSVKGGFSAAGIVGTLLRSGRIENCSFTGTVEATGDEGDDGDTSNAQAGGIVHQIYSNAVVKDCNFSGTVIARAQKTTSGYSHAGGIVGLIGGLTSGDADTPTIINCTVSSTSNITSAASTSSYAGGIAGALGGGTIENCESDANINATYVGGILGQYYGTSTNNLILRNNRYTKADREVGYDGTGVTPPPDNEEVNNNTLNIELSPLNDEYKEYLADPETYYEENPLGHIPSAIDMSNIDGNSGSGSSFKAAALLPKYDLRDSVTLPAVRNQGSYRTCWAHAALGAMEMNYVKNKMSSVGTLPDLSELHMAWFVYSDPQSGSKFTKSKGRENQGILEQGGRTEQATAFLTRLAGAARESALPYSQASKVASLVANKKPEDYNRVLRVKEIVKLGSGSYNKRDEIKQLIYDYGGVYASYKNSSSVNASSYYFKTDARSGHAIVLIGWDDNYSKSNFSGTQPDHDGAWLVRNSRGEGYGNSGYFWMSYDQPLGDIAAFAVSSENNVNYYGYDALGYTRFANINWSANIFQARGNETLKEIGFYTNRNNDSYELSVYNFGTEKPVMTPIKGTPVFTKTGSFEHAGYHTVTLSNPVSLKKGEYFTVVLHMNVTHNQGTAVEEESYEKGIVVNRGESLFSRNGTTWADGVNTSGVRSDDDTNNRTPQANACIKAFTVTEGGGGSDENKNNNNSNSGGGGCNAGFGLLYVAFASLIIFNRRSTR